MTHSHPEPLITTKLAPPRRARHTLPRPRLDQLIQQIGETTLALVKAPPGFGKTTLISTWAEAARAGGARVAWLTLDEHDDDVERLLQYMTASVRHALQAPSVTLQSLALMPREQLISRLVHEVQQCDAPCYMFLDDCHTVPPAILEAAVAPLVRYAPDNLHLILSGRSDLPASLSQSLYGDAALLLGSNQLRFTLEETCELIAGDSALQASTAHSLQQSTDGWIAGLRARQLMLRQTPQAVIPAGLGVSEVFDNLLVQLPAPLLEQLLSLSVVEQFSATLAGELCADTDGHALIQQLEQQQLFINALDDSGTWYSLHPLFREHLLRHLRTRQGAQQQALVRAARWFAEQKMWAHAVRCALAAGEEQDALRWISECAMPLVEHGDFIQLLDWQRRLHDRLIEAPVPLQLALAWAFGLAMLSDHSLQLIDAARRALGPNLEHSELKWECLALKAMLLALADKSTAGASLARECLPHLNDRPWIANVLHNVIGFGDLQACDWQAFYSLPATLAMPLKSQRYLVTLAYRHCLIALGDTNQGRLLQAGALLQEAIRQATPGMGSVDPHASPVLRGLPAALLSYIRYQQGRHKEARLLNLESLTIIKQVGFLDCVTRALSTACRLDILHGNPLAARAQMDEAEALAQSRNWPRLSVHMLLERGRLALLEHNMAEASACAQQLEQTLQSNPDIDAGQSVLLLLQLWIAASETPPKLPDTAQLQQQLHIARTCNASIHLSELLIAVAVLEEVEQACTSLLEASQLIEQSGACQILLDYPAQGLLCNQLNICSAQSTLTRNQREKLSALLGMIQGEVQNLTDPTDELTSKELQILNLVADGLSNKEIAKQLGVTPETIKSHMKNIFFKLGVSSRTQAAMMLREPSA